MSLLAISDRLSEVLSTAKLTAFLVTRRLLLRLVMANARDRKSVV